MSRRRGWSLPLLTKLKYVHPGAEKSKQPTRRPHDKGANFRHLVRKQEGSSGVWYCLFPAVPHHLGGHWQGDGCHFCRDPPGITSHLSTALTRHRRTFSLGGRCISSAGLPAHVTRDTQGQRSSRGCGKSSRMGREGPFWHSAPQPHPGQTAASRERRGKTGLQKLL